MQTLVVPDSLDPNLLQICTAPAGESGGVLFDVLRAQTGLADLSGVKLLDVGCGVRFAQTILEQRLDVRRYCGIAFDPGVIEFLHATVRDSRFEFHRIDVYDRRYNQRGIPLTPSFELPVAECFDLICAVSTHLDWVDSAALLRVLRRYVTDDGFLFLSCNVDDSVDRVHEVHPGSPLAQVCYTEDFMLSLLAKARWHVVGFHPNRPYIHYFVARPVT
jgi:SAM-dependent methyltransferase